MYQKLRKTYDKKTVGYNAKLAAAEAALYEARRFRRQRAERRLLHAGLRRVAEVLKYIYF
jgi:hypothetical protein